MFRNETLDATHLAEFHQIEGVVADRNLNLGNLMGVIKTFFDKLGTCRVRVRRTVSFSHSVSLILLKSYLAQPNTIFYKYNTLHIRPFGTLRFAA